MSLVRKAKKSYYSNLDQKKIVSLINRVLGMLACSRALRVYMLACLVCLRACMLPCFRASVFGVLACFRLACLACSRAWRAYLLAMIKCFTFLRVCVLGVLRIGVLTFLSNYLFCLHKLRLCN